MGFESLTVAEHGGRPLVLAPDGGALVTAGLTFRVGWADESIRLHGLTHLVEHLAHVGIPDRELPYNASVDATLTEFWVRGTADEVIAHLQALLDTLAAPPVEELEREVGVLRAEGGGPLSPLLARRFSNRGYGTASWGQFALETATADDVRRWAAERFVAENLVLWSTAPLDPALTLSVPRGAPATWPPIERAPGCALPAHVVWDYAAVGWSGEVRAGWAGSFALEVLDRRARERLRHEMGSSYAITSTSVALGPDIRLRSVVADRDERSDAVAARDALLDDLDEVATAGPSADELATLLTARERSLHDPDAAPGVASMGARQFFADQAIESPDDLRRSWRAVTVDEVRDATAELRDSLLLAVPAAARPSERELPPLDRRTDDEPLDAAPFRCARSRQGLTDGGTGSAVRIDPGVGLSATRGGQTIRIPFGDVTAVVVLDGIDVHAYDGADRVVRACVHDEDDRRRWLEPLVAAVGEDKIVRIDRGRQRQLQRLSTLAEEQLGSRTALNGRLYDGSYALKARLIWLLEDDWRWLDLHEVRSAEASEGWRGGTLRVALEAATLTAERVRAKGRATALAEEINARSAAVRAAEPAAAGD